MKEHRKQWFPREMLEQRAHEFGRTPSFRTEVEGVLETVLDGGWMVVEIVEVHDGQRTIAELTICPAPPEDMDKKRGVYTARMYGERAEDDIVPTGGITSTLLRKPKVGRYVDRVIEHYREWVEKWFGPEALERFDNEAPKPTRGGPKKQNRPSDLYYATLARDYAKLIELKNPKPTATLAEMYREPVKTIRSHVNLARRNGFLTDTVKGVASGKMTPHAQKVLEKANNKGGN